MPSLGQLGYADFTALEGARSRPALPRLTWLDMALICLFLIGMYTNYTIMVSAKVPFPSAPSGVAGLILLWRRRDLITPRAFAGFIIIVLLFLISIFCATDIRFLPRRTNGLIQLTYSLTIGYALFLTVTQASRRQIAGLFLGFSLVILVGCLLEGHAGLRPLSDAVRNVLYSQGIYENDLRDVLFYKRVRPKFFASEPASVTFCYTLFTFLWMVVSRWRWKLVAYVGLVGLGLFAMPGPTLLLMLLLIVPYMLFLASRRAGRLDVGRLLMVACIAVVFFGAFVVLAAVAVSGAARSGHVGRRSQLLLPGARTRAGRPRRYARYPFAGAGLSGDPFIENEITNVYLRSFFLLRRMAGRDAGNRASDQLFLAALDLSRAGLGTDHDGRADGLVAGAWRAQPRLLLDSLGHPRAGVGRLCRADLLGRAVPRRRSRDIASAPGYRRRQQNRRAVAAGPSG